jgi:hypothetical protein
MRNIFDQYDEPENKLTHALACCLREDRGLLRSFVKWMPCTPPPSRKALEVVEQTLPGTDEGHEGESQRLGLPDMWIHDHDNWSLIIENKVKSGVNAGQLRRHSKTASRRGFENHSIVVISPQEPSPRKLPGASHVTWPEVYVWLSQQHRNSEWARRLVDYMESLEARMITDGYLDKGSLTTFSGIRFTPESPWNYGEAKRLLRLAMQKLREDKRLHRLHMDASRPGRTAITGSDGKSVWDFLPLKLSGRAGDFNQSPHLTLGIRQDAVVVLIIFPDKMRNEYRANLRRQGQTHFCEEVSEVAANLDRVLEKADGAQPWMEVVQRRFKHRRGAPTTDARLEYDLRTAANAQSKRRGEGPQVKLQPQWLEAAFSAFAHKQSNLQLAVGARFPIACPAFRTPNALDYFSGTWLACEPLLKAAIG